MTSTKLLFALFSAALFLTTFSNCTDDGGLNDDDGSSPSMASLEIRLTDDPGDYEAVIVEVVDVQVKLQGEEWIDLDDNGLPATIDLLELTNGTDTLLADADFLPGTLREVRLILGENNFVQIDGNLIELRTPSAQQSGLKIQIENGELTAGNLYTLVLDFDAGSSVVRAGNSGNYNLRPVIRASLVEVDVTNGDTGALAGAVAPGNAQHYVMAYRAGVDTFGTFTDDDGLFLINFLPEDSYTVEVLAPQDSAYADQVIENVGMNAGEITDLGVIDMQD